MEASKLLPRARSRSSTANQDDRTQNFRYESGRMLRRLIARPPLLGLLALGCSNSADDLGTTTHPPPSETTVPEGSEGSETQSGDEASNPSADAESESESSGANTLDASESADHEMSASTTGQQESESSDASTVSEDDGSDELDTTEDTSATEDTGAADLDCESECLTFGDVCFLRCRIELPPVSLVRIEDVDSDTQADLVLGSTSAPALEIWRSNGNGGFEAQEIVQFPDELGSLRSYLRADIDNDGVIDWLAEGRALSRPHAYSPAHDRFSAFGNARELEYLSWTVIDLGGDDYLDLALGYWDSLEPSSSESGWELFAGRSDFGFDQIAGEVVTSRGYNTTALAGDLDGDGHDDLVLQGWSTGETSMGGTSVVFGQGNGSLGDVAYAPYPANTSHTATVGRFHHEITGLGLESIFHVSGFFDVEVGVVAASDDRFVVPIGRELELPGDPWSYEDPRAVRRHQAEVDDVVMFHTQGQRFEYFRNDGRGNFSRDDEVLTAPGWFRSMHWGMGDLNGDDVLDYVVGDGELHEAVIFLSDD